MKPSSTKTYRAERRRADLTEREKRILRLVCDGLSNAEIARQLAVPSDVVKSSLQRIFRKIDGARPIRQTLPPLEEHLDAGDSPPSRDRSR